MILIEKIYQKLNNFAFILQKDFFDVKKISFINRRNFTQKSFNLFKKKFLESVKEFSLDIDIYVNSLNLMEISINLFSISLEINLNSQKIYIIYLPLEMDIFYNYQKISYFNGDKITRPNTNNVLISSNNVLFGHNLMLIKLCRGEFKEVILQKEHFSLNETAISICKNTEFIQIKNLDNSLSFTII
ncbi:hypothetical protein AB836_00815 [Rickettsiales bacterium (ex Bugula neritina AB1)]|nr:hypothetical protein AB836_00815 [Rickettsiales bacterium (ex Bugula neritina AB1)]